MGDVRRALLALTLAGCNQVYGLDPTTVRSLEPPRCSTVQFSVPQILPEFDDDDDIEFDPQLSADGKELWLAFATPIAGGSNRNLMYRSVRVGDTFGEPVLTDLVNMNGRHIGDPALTADGLRMIFRVEDTPAQFYEAIRESPNQFPFDTIVPLLGAPGEAKSFDLTWDGLRMYVANGDGIVTRLTRPARDKPFVEEPLTLLANAAFPTISGDELEIFYVRPNQPAADADLYRSERASTSEPFTAEQLVLENASDPDIAPTSSEMIVAYMSALAIMKRTCDED